MNAEHRQILREKRLVLEKNIELDETLIKYLRQYKLFNQFMWEDIKSISDVLDLLPTRGPKAFENFIEILKKAKYEKEVEFLKKSKVSVSLMSVDSSLFYKMSSNPLGYCLIINNVKFEKKTDDKTINTYRHGSDKDAESLRDFFTRNKFDVTLERNLEAEVMKKTIKQFSERSFHCVDSMILIILSHGGQIHNQDIVYGTDWEYIFKYNIYNYFTNVNPNLMLKPKVFIFNACRGKGMDYGVPKTFSNQSLDADLLGQSDKYLPTLSDILVVHSSLPDQVSVLDHDEGSFFCSALISVLNEYHKVYDLETMIKLVNSRLEDKISLEFRVVQAAHVETKGWKKMIMLCPPD